MVPDHSPLFEEGAYRRRAESAQARAAGLEHALRGIQNMTKGEPLGSPLRVIGERAESVLANPTGDFKTRLLDELEELRERLGKLDEFLLSSKYHELSVDEQGRLVAQHRYMAGYEAVLRQRVDAVNARWGVEPSGEA